MKKNPIGVFDSGYGGLTVLKSLTEQLPEYDYVYIGDNARTPYGTRSFDVVYEYTLQAVKTFFEMGCELVILACNTASAKALRNIQQKDLPHLGAHKRVLGVIRPSAETVANHTQTNHVGVLGTTGTVNSQSYVIEINKLNPQLQVTQESCPIWVPLVENNQFDNIGGNYFIKHHIDNLFRRNQNIDTLILGCTHYPILINQIKKYTPKNVTILSQGDIIATSLKDYLKRHPEMDAKCSKNGNVKYFTTDDSITFDKNAELFIGKPIQSNKITLSDDLAT